MCDTLVALGNATADGSVLFAKNSDREPNEAHELLFIPRTTHPEGSNVRCTYVRIPQVKETFAVLLAKPFWIWGAEMGANEHGVVIGNEALFTKMSYEKEPGLTGMDFLRLALERANSSFSALKVITNLLETYGQGGNYGFSRRSYYHNSFLIADTNDVWLLETVGRQWAAKRVKDLYCISNAITIGKEWDLASDNLVDYAIEKGWWKNRKDFDFGRCYSDFLYTRIAYAKARHRRATEILNINKGKITVKTMIAILRDHGSKDSPGWTPAKRLTDPSICMHVGCGPIRRGQTTGSMVSDLRADLQTHWVMGTSAPCTGIFKPVWIDTGLPNNDQSPTGSYDESTLWWSHERLHRAVLFDYETRLVLYKKERDKLENCFIKAVESYRDKMVVERAKFTDQCFSKSKEATSRWIDQVLSTPVKNHMPFCYMRKLRQLNRKAKLEIK